MGEVSFTQARFSDIMLKMGGSMENYKFNDVQIIMDGNDISIDGQAFFDGEGLIQLEVDRAYFWDGQDWRETMVESQKALVAIGRDINLIREIKGE